MPDHRTSHTHHESSHHYALISDRWRRLIARASGSAIELPSLNGHHVAASVVPSGLKPADWFVAGLPQEFLLG